MDEFQVCLDAVPPLHLSVVREMGEYLSQSENQVPTQGTFWGTVRPYLLLKNHPSLVGVELVTQRDTRMMKAFLWHD